MEEKHIFGKAAGTAGIRRSACLLSCCCLLFQAVSGAGPVRAAKADSKATGKMAVATQSSPAAGTEGQDTVVSADTAGQSATGDDAAQVPGKGQPVAFSQLNDDTVFIKQSQSKLCTLAAAAMMVRRAAMLSGNEQWAQITEQSMRKDAWIEKTGLKWSFQTSGISVAHKALASKDELAKLLDKHPEGIVIYNSRKPHAILITDYINGTFYCSDPAKNSPAGRYPVSAASITVESADWYWYVKYPEGLTVDMDGYQEQEDPQNPDGLGNNQAGSTSEKPQSPAPAADGAASDEIAGGQEYQIGGLTYQILNEDKKTVVCTGQVKNTTSVTVPDEVELEEEAYTVVGIAQEAFANAAKLKTVTVGENVVSIAKKAFYQCKKLKKVVIRALELQEIGADAFAKINKKAQILITSDQADPVNQLRQIESFANLLTGTSIPGTVRIGVD